MVEDYKALNRKAEIPKGQTNQRDTHEETEHLLKQINEHQDNVTTAPHHRRTQKG